MYGGNFVLSVLRDGKPQKEMNGNVGLPFDTEYKIRLKNKNNRQAMARVFVDGIQVCALGDFVLGASSSLDLERFVDTSLTRGKKFKFVSLEHSEVDDPTSSENGIIKIEFRLEKQTPFICIDPIPIQEGPGDLKIYDWTYWYDNTCGGNTNDASETVVSYCSAPDVGSTKFKAGATVGGAVSSQQFYYASDFDTESVPTVLTLKLVSSGDLNNNKGISNKISKSRYCGYCGSKCKADYKFCYSCGKRM